MPYTKIRIHLIWSTKNRIKVITKEIRHQLIYMAASVSESNLDRVRKYILNQEAHHTRKSFQKEIKELLEKMGYNNSSGIYAGEN